MLSVSDHRSAQAAEGVPADAQSLLAMPSVDSAVRDALNNWLRRRIAPVFRLSGNEYEIRWLVAADPRWQVVVELAAGTHRAWLALDGFAAIDPLMVGEPLSLMPVPLRNLVVHRVIARLLSAAPKALAAAADVRAIHWNVPLSTAASCRLMFTITRRSDRVQSMGALVFETAAAIEWLDATLAVDDASRSIGANVRVPLHLRIGRSMLPTNELSALRPGDVVWIETASIARAGLAVELGTAEQECIWRCRVQRHALRIVAAGTPVESARTAVTGNTRGAQVMSAERWRLDVPVTFELATLSMKVNEIEHLQPGQIVELPQDVATASVSLRVAGTPVAEGTLIVVGKRLGVRVARVLARTESHE